MRNFPKPENKTYGISLEKAIEDHKEKMRAAIREAENIALRDMLFGPYNDYKEESGLYDNY